MRFWRLKYVLLLGLSRVYQKVGLVTQRLVGESKADGGDHPATWGLVIQCLVGESKSVVVEGLAGRGLVTQRLVGESKVIEDLDAFEPRCSHPTFRG